ncbi:UDP-N-acetylmuramate dehydrogenase [Rothia sp. P13129]|uniref:UDP-N-acetylmuramate dehydrogenase n=1 Tax=Rothia sp. P13129 TaxID=3402664 RepID=UPI003AC6E395
MNEMLLKEITTAEVGGPAKTYIRASSEADIINALKDVQQRSDALLIIGGGSNILVSDEGFNGTVLHIVSEGIEILDADSNETAVTVRVQAGHSWDGFVEHAVNEGWSGVEALSGIPGTVGATPVQNVGAYGSEVAHTITQVRVWDRNTNEIITFSNEELCFSYRDSLLKQHMSNGLSRYVVLSVVFTLEKRAESAPIRYAELARQLGVNAGDRAELQDVREKVLMLRASKGMVLNPQDRDTYSTGSFFTNPIIDSTQLEHLPQDAPQYPVYDAQGNLIDGKTKLSAAWLIEHAGFSKGFGLDAEQHDICGARASLSTKHTLAITNRGNAQCQDILAIARTVREGVTQKFGVHLVPEPVMVGVTLD